MTTRPAQYFSAFERLSALPAVFSLNTLVRATGLPRASAKVLLARWSAKKLVESAGPRAGIYFNRVLDREGAAAHAVKALVMKYPSATLCGASVLHSAGWTTQIPSTLHVAVEARNSYVKMDGVTLFPRPVAWFQFMQNHRAWTASANAAAEAETNTYGLRALSPEWALADLYADKSGHAWQPEVDDLDLPRAAVGVVRRACEAMGKMSGWAKQVNFKPSPVPAAPPPAPTSRRGCASLAAAKTISLALSDINLQWADR